MRAQIRYSEQPIIDEAISQTRQSFINAGVPGFTTPPPTTPPQSFSTAGTDENGNVVTLYPAMTELDSTEGYGMTS